MANSFFQARSWLFHWLNAVDQHSLHSPFFFDFYKNVVRKDGAQLKIAEDLRNKLLKDNRSISVQDLGTGSSRNKKRRIADIAARSLSSPKFSSLYRRIIERYKCKTIIELGTSLGVNTLYLSTGSGSTVQTFEGSDSVADLAALTFEFAGAKNISIIKGNIDTTLPIQLSLLKKIDFAFLDANHSYKATSAYFQKILHRVHEGTIIVLDDIHYSAEMERAWNEIKKNDLVYASADLYRCGILFFDPSLNKQHVILQF